MILKFKPLGIYILLVCIIGLGCKRNITVAPTGQTTFLNVFPEPENQSAYYVKAIPGVGFYAITSKDTSYAGYGFEVIYVNHYDINGKLVSSQRLNIHNFIQGALITEIPNGYIRVHGRKIGSRLWDFGYYEIDPTGKVVGEYTMLTESGFQETLTEENPNEWLHMGSASMNISLEGNYNNRSMRLYNSNINNWPGSGWPGCLIKGSLFNDSIRPFYGAVYNFTEATDDGDYRVYKLIGDFILPPFTEQSNTAFGIFTIRQKRDDNLLWNIVRETEVSNISVFNHYPNETTNSGLLHCWLHSTSKIHTISGPHYKSGKKWSYPANLNASKRNDLVYRCFDSENQNMLVQKTLNFNSTVIINNICEGQSGNIYLLGYKLNDAFNTQPLVACITDGGKLLWEQKLNNFLYGSYFSASEDNNGHVYIIGTTNSFGVGSYGNDIIVNKCNQKNGRFE